MVQYLKLKMKASLKMMESGIKKKRGRPAAFDYDTALEAAMQLFWRHGYEGTSMQALTHAMGMNKTSIYAAYGSKEALFHKALNRYAQGPVKFVTEALLQPTAVGVVYHMLTVAAEFLTNPQTPHGCLIIQGALSCSHEARHIHALLSGYRASYENQLAERLERAKCENDLPADADTVAMAKLVATVHQGMSVQAASGATKEALLHIAVMVANLFKSSVEAAPAVHKS